MLLTSTFNHLAIKIRLNDNLCTWPIRCVALSGKSLFKCHQFIIFQLKFYIVFFLYYRSGSLLDVGVFAKHGVLLLSSLISFPHTLISIITLMGIFCITSWGLQARISSPYCKTKVMLSIQVSESRLGLRPTTSK